MGLTVLDAGVLIGVLDDGDAHHIPASQALRTAEEEHVDLALPASALSEILVGPSRRGVDAIATVDGLIGALVVEIVTIDEPIAREAAALRAICGIRLPDALVVATAIILRAGRLLTTDAHWPAGVATRLDGAIEVVGRT
ncbi:MAG TPA: PIN domain-containing protein [Acidimicrobiales bacterium]|jgi:predicted nucleic acid-binding protein